MSSWRPLFIVKGRGHTLKWNLFLVRLLKQFDPVSSLYLLLFTLLECSLAKLHQTTQTNINTKYTSYVYFVITVLFQWITFIWLNKRHTSTSFIIQRANNHVYMATFISMYLWTSKFTELFHVTQKESRWKWTERRNDGGTSVKGFLHINTCSYFLCLIVRNCRNEFGILHLSQLYIYRPYL